MNHLTYGFDGALRHGVLVQAEWNLDRPKTLIEFEITFEWKKSSLLSVGTKSTPGEIQRLGHEVAKSANKKIPLGIDWDPDHPFRKSNRVQIMKHAYFMGFVTRAFLEKGISVAIIDPRTVRDILGLKYNLKKEEVWHEFKTMVAVPSQDLPSDLMDALIISYIIALAEQKEEHESPQISLFSSGASGSGS
jgi:hypothetical protein